MNGQAGNTPPQKLVDFNDELSELLNKYQYDLGCVTFVTPDGRIAGKVQVFDQTPKKPEPGVPLTPTAPPTPSDPTTPTVVDTGAEAPKEPGSPDVIANETPVDTTPKK